MISLHRASISFFFFPKSAQFKMRKNRWFLPLHKLLFFPFFSPPLGESYFDELHRYHSYWYHSFPIQTFKSIERITYYPKLHPLWDSNINQSFSSPSHPLRVLWQRKQLLWSHSLLSVLIVAIVITIGNTIDIVGVGKRRWISTFLLFE